MKILAEELDKLIINLEEQIAEVYRGTHGRPL
jgi:hypothetical protein